MRTPNSIYLEIKMKALTIFNSLTNKTFRSILASSKQIEKCHGFYLCRPPLCLAGNIWILLSASVANLLQSVVLVEVCEERQRFEN